MKVSDLEKELKERGTAEISNGIVNQVTQALDEKESEVDYLIFGVRRKQAIIPIDEACSKCDFWDGKFPTIKACQISQQKDAQARGFNKLICPHQFKDS